MYRRPSKKQELIKRAAIYSAMSMAVIVIASLLVFLLLGYRLDQSNGKIEQSALIQVETVPNGASVYIDGVALGSTTPTKVTVSPTQHDVVVWREGYKAWHSVINTLPGTFYWINYVRLVPSNPNVENVASYTNVSSVLSSDNHRFMLIQKQPTDYGFELVDIKNDNPDIKTVTLPSTITTNLDNLKNRKLTPESWDDSGRFVLIKLTSDSRTHWLVLDTQDVTKSRDVTSLLDVDFDSLKFMGTSGNILYGITAGDIRKVDLSQGTISRALVRHASEFDIYDSKMIYYVGTNDVNGVNLPVAGTYRDGDDTSTILHTAANPSDVLKLSISSYYNQDYVALSENQNVTILRGRFPTSTENVADNLSSFATMKLSFIPQYVFFSGDGDYLVMQNGSQFSWYYVEHMLSGDVRLSYNVDSKLKWLDNDHLFSTASGRVNITDFNGENPTSPIESMTGQDATLNPNGKYLYSVTKTTTGYALSRVKMILN